MSGLIVVDLVKARKGTIPKADSNIFWLLCLLDRVGGDQRSCMATQLQLSYDLKWTDVLERPFVFLCVVVSSKTRPEDLTSWEPAALTGKNQGP